MEDQNANAADTATQAPQNVLLMPQYRCHKTVRAAKILAIISGTSVTTLNLLIPGKNEQEENGTITVDVDQDWLTRNPKLEVGGYFVEYELMPGETTAYTAYSPAAAFESGYSLPVELPPIGPGFADYRKKNVQPMRPYVPGEDLSTVSVSAEDTPEEGGMIAINPNNPADQWYVAKQFFLDNYVPAGGPVATPENSGAPDMPATATVGAEPPSHLPAYQQRVVDECAQLDERLTKLKAFFGTETFTGLKPDDQHLLQSQADHMANYLQILKFRVSQF